jgi:hypothetical protein
VRGVGAGPVGPAVVDRGPAVTAAVALVGVVAAQVGHPELLEQRLLARRPGGPSLVPRVAHVVDVVVELGHGLPPFRADAAPTGPAGTGMGAGGCPLKRQRASQAAIAATSYFDNRSQGLRADGGITISPAKSKTAR